MSKPNIITVSVAPAWDLVATAPNLQWNQHRTVEIASDHPAGKSLNVSRGLDWMSVPSIAAGLWGKEDLSSAIAALRPLKNLKPAFTAVPGRTRRNINLIDPVSSRELHLRFPNPLASEKSIAALKADLIRLVRPGDLVVLSGSLPAEFLDNIIALTGACRKVGARLILDSSAAPLKALVNNGGILLIKPNLEELSELIGCSIANTESAIIKAACPLLEKVNMILVSRGPKGALLMKKNLAISGSAVLDFPATSTLACGDYLLAGFIAAYSKNEDLSICLSAALKAATAKALDLIDAPWPKVAKRITTHLRVLA